MSTSTIYQTLKDISATKSYEQFQQISEQTLYTCVKQSLPQIMVSPAQTHFLRDKQFYTVLKVLCDQYVNAVSLMNAQRQNHSNPYSMGDSNQKGNIDFGKRKTTRAMLAMRNVKNQQQLKKDQIFVRAIPRTQSCIAFMLNNKNFPRIEVKLSCNQHLQYLTSYLTNKWLRGKVGVGYQIVLYPDPSLYLRRCVNEDGNKRSQVKYEPLNNYLMFTDIMAAYGNPNNSSLNLYYQVMEMRKQKSKIIKQKQIPSISYSHLPPPPSPALKSHLDSSYYDHMMETPKNKILHSQRNSYDKKMQNSSKQIHHHIDDEMSIGGPQSRDRKSHHPYSGSFDEEDLGSLAFNWNHFNSNIASNFFNNNSNTFINNHHHTNNHNNSQIPPPRPSIEGQRRMLNFGTSQHQQNVALSNNNNNSNSNLISNPQDKLDNIRNIINMIEKQGGAGLKQHSPLVDSAEKQQNSIKQEVSMKKQVKQVKIVPIIRKKNQNQ